jgi:hypothetical protein
MQNTHKISNWESKETDISFLQLTPDQIAGKYQLIYDTKCNTRSKKSTGPVFSYLHNQDFYNKYRTDK